MLPGMLTLLLLSGWAAAGDRALYDRALALVDEHYLYPELLQSERMLADAARQASSRIEWLLVEPEHMRVHLTDGEGGWQADVRLVNDHSLAQALDELEDAILAAGLPIEEDVDLRVELLRGAVKSLDRHSVVLHARGLERFDERLSGTLTGIGVSIGIEDAALLVQSVVEDGPADRGGVYQGDRIVRIDGVSTVGMNHTDASARLRGAVGSTVVVTVQRGVQLTDLTLVRGQVRIRNVTSSRAENGVGVVTVEHFSEQTHDYLEDSLRELDAQDALDEGLVVDLRGNTGGSLIQSADAADTFLDGGLLVTTVGRDGGPVSGLVPRLDAHPDRVVWPMPVVVLMDHSTASGSEILAGALAAHDRALLVGTTSFGKGTVQKVYQIDPAIKLKLTVAEYLVRGEQHVANIGLQPDVAISPVYFTADGAWWADPARERARLPEGTPLVHVAQESPGWREEGMSPPSRDAVMDLGSWIAAAAEGVARADLLEAAARIVHKVEPAEDAAIVAAFAARGIDWGARTVDLPTPEPEVAARLDADGPLRAGEERVLTVRVENHGEDLYRAAVRLRSVNRLWDDLVLPIGRIQADAVGIGEGVVHIPWTIPSRADAVDLLLEAQGLAPTKVGATVLAVEAVPAPPLALTLRATPSGDVVRVGVDLDSRGESPLSGVSARFRFPDLPGVELVEGGTPPEALPARGRVEAELHVRVGGAYTAETIPLSLVVEADGYGIVDEWPVELPREGGVVRLEAPLVVARPSAVVQAPGTATLTVRATDDRALDHLVILGGVESLDRSRYEPQLQWSPDKLAWRPGLGRRADLSIPVEVGSGANRFDVIAEDRAGLRTVQTLYLLGDPEIPTEAVDGE